MANKFHIKVFRYDHKGGSEIDVEQEINDWLDLTDPKAIVDVQLLVFFDHTVISVFYEDFMP